MSFVGCTATVQNAPDKGRANTPAGTSSGDSCVHRVKKGKRMKNKKLEFLLCLVIIKNFFECRSSGGVFYIVSVSVPPLCVVCFLFS